MFLAIKYEPKNIDKTILHKDINKLLKIASKDDSINNIIMCGQEGCGIEQIVKTLLNQIYDKTTDNTKQVTYQVTGSGNRVIDVVVTQSNHHIVIDPLSTNFDRYLIQHIVKEYARKMPLGIFGVHKPFKTVVINKVDKLSYFAQTSLRMTMEIYSKTCRFIMLCETMSSVLSPLVSRSFQISIPLPTDNQLYKWLFNISVKEKIPVSLSGLFDIIKQSKNNPRKALWELEKLKYGTSKRTLFEQIIVCIVNLIESHDLLKIMYIRMLISTLITTNIDSTTIIKSIMEEMLQRNISETNKIKIIEITSTFEHSLIRGRREMVHFDAFINHAMEILSSN